MENGVLFFRALLWSILLGVIVDPWRLRLRGFGPGQLGPLKVLGLTAVLGVAMFSFDGYEDTSVSRGLRGGMPGITVKKENPAFRVMRYDGTKARVTYEKLKADFKKRGPFNVKEKGNEVVKTGEQIEAMVDGWFNVWVIETSHSDTIPLRPKLVRRVLQLRKLIQDKKARVKTDGTLDFIPSTNDGFMEILTETGQPIEIPEHEVLDWVYTQYFIHSHCTVMDGFDVEKKITLDQVVEMVDEIMMKEKVEVFNEIEDKWESLDRAGLEKLLDYEERDQIAWEDKWIGVSEDLFTFMEQRFEQAKNKDSKPKPPPPSLREFAAPEGFDPLEQDGDGLFLVTPEMKEIEAER